MIKLVFVCTGNTCRSPMAESIFKYLIKMGKKDCKVTSKGLKINPQETEVNTQAKQVLLKNHLAVPTHKASKLTTKTVKESDYIITMTQSHKELLVADILKSRNPEDKNLVEKIYCIKELVNGIDIPDPYGYGEQEYEAVFNVLKTSLERLYIKLFPR